MSMVTDLAGPPLDIPEPPKPKPPAPPKAAKVLPPLRWRAAPPKLDIANSFLKPKIEQFQAETPSSREADLPKVNDTFQPTNLKVTVQPARPRDPVKTGVIAARQCRQSTRPCQLRRFRPAGSATLTEQAKRSEQESQYRAIWESRVALRTGLAAMAQAASMASVELSPAPDLEMAWRSRQRTTSAAERFKPLASRTRTIKSP